MTIYNLDETPDIFIRPAFLNNKFVYHMDRIKAEQDKARIHTIDFKSDKVFVYGVEIQESMLDKLYDCLIFRTRPGLIAVNCDGACYIMMRDECRRPIYNVIFDWSPFGIIVPNSVNDSLRKQFNQREKEIVNLKHQLSYVGNDLESSKKENVELKEQLSMSKKCQHQLAEIESELRATVIELELLRKRETELQEQVCINKLEIQTREDRLSLVNSELTNTKSALEFSNKTVKQLEDQLAFCKNIQDDQLSSSKLEFEERVEDMKAELQKMEDQLSSVKNELHLTNIQLKSSLEKSTIQKKLYRLLTSMLQTISRAGSTHSKDSLLPFKELDTSIYTLPITTQEFPDSMRTLQIISSSTSEQDIQGQSSDEMELVVDYIYSR